MNRGQWDIAPHGLVAVAAFMLLIVAAIHILGFRIVGAVRVGR